METKQPEPDNTTKIKLTFILFGISSLLSWNAILTELDFFNVYVEGLEPSKSFSFLNFAFNIVLQFILLWKKDLFKIKYQLIFGLGASIALLIIIPTLIKVLEESKTLINALTVILILIMGLINALCSSGFFAFVSFFPKEQIVALSTGQGFSGIIMNIIEYFILFFIGDKKDKTKLFIGAIIFFSISSVILLITLIVLIFSLNTEYFKYYLELQDIEEINEIDAGNEIENNERLEDDQENLIKPKLTFIQMFNILKEIDILCCILYIVTFAEFPVGFIGAKVFSLGNYNFNTILTIYNAFDTLGRYLTSFIKPNKIWAYIIILSRIILLITIPVNYNFQVKSTDPNVILTSFGVIINISLLAITNGIGTTLCFAIAPSLVNDEYKGQAGASVSFFIIVGICLGSILQFATGPIFKKIREK